MPVIRTIDRGFLFRNVSDVALATQGTCRHGDKKASGRYPAVEASHNNVRRLAILITLDTVDGPPMPLMRAAGGFYRVSFKEEFSGTVEIVSYLEIEGEKQSTRRTQP